MPATDRNFAVAKNMQVIEWLKTELLGGVTNLFKAMTKNSEDAWLEALSGVITTAYVLARRLGISFARLESKIVTKLRSYISDEHEMEKWYGDLSALLNHILNKK
ncbi:MAG: MazG-like family protein [bacterium]|jgi:hypothetical protein